MATAYDFWKTTDPSDDGSQEAIDQIQCDLARDADEVLSAAEDIEPPTGLIAAALMNGNWEAVQNYYYAQWAQNLGNRATEIYNARREDVLLLRRWRAA